MKIYKVRAWVNDNKKGNVEHPFKREEVFVKLDAGKRFFKEMVNEIKTWEQYSKYDCHVEFFIPHIFNDGCLSYWPDDNKYIDKYPK